MGAAKFPHGQLVATIGIIELVDRTGLYLVPYLVRHLTGDWGDLDQADKQANEQALAKGGRLFSAYVTPYGKIWIITEADRKVTTILTPDEY